MSAVGRVGRRPLAVFVPVLGTPSETFIRRHIEDLAPGGTVVVARRLAPPSGARWSADAPTLLLDPLHDEWGGEIEQEAVASFLQAQGVQSVLLEFLDIWLPFLSTVRGLNLRCVAHAHGYDVSSRLRDGYWRSAYLAYRDVDAVVTMSGHTRQRLVDLGLATEQVSVIPYGVDLAAACEHSARTPVKVLATGRLVAKKHPVATVRACAQAADRGADLRLTVIGDGPLMQDVQEAARSAELSVRLLGERAHSDVLAEMQDADVFCQHSVVDPETGDEEGLPVAILEAMAHGLPVVSTRHAGIPEAVRDGTTGLLGDEGDVDAMAESIRLLASDPSLRASLGAAGRERVRTHFSWTTERRQLARLLHLQEDATKAGVWEVG